MIGSFYDKIFTYVDLPWVPSVLEPIIHTHVKSFLMILVSSGIDAMVATFRQVGVFTPKETVKVEATVGGVEKNPIVENFLNNIKKIVRS